MSFLLAERRAAEPVLSPKLVRIRAHRMRAAAGRDTLRSHADLLPASSWRLLRALRPKRSLSPARLAEYGQVPLPVIQDALDEIEQRRLATRACRDLLLTDAGREAAAKLSAARQDSFAELLGDWWGPDRPTDLVEPVDELSAQLSGSDRDRPHVPAPRRDRVRRA